MIKGEIVMSIFEIIDELLKCSNEEIDYAILSLMIKKKLDSHRVFDLYMKAIEYDRGDIKDKLIESNSTILNLLTTLKHPKSKEMVTNKYADMAIHRALYNLNISKQFQMEKLNEKYRYDEEKDKHLSWYWREHNKNLK